MNSRLQLKANNTENKTKLLYLFNVRTTLFDSLDPVEHDIITVCLKQIGRPTIHYKLKYMLLTTIVIGNTNRTGLHRQRKYNISSFLTTHNTSRFNNLFKLLSITIISTSIVTEIL